ncbi:MAG: hypothetical protein HFH86_02415 [Bacilli bacterium]|jgi:hypothetical protein|nr:hypothetical protein [Bacilli bacterium]
MKIKEENLYEIFRRLCNKEYALGIHGTFNIEKPTLMDALQRADRIMTVGLENFYSDSTPRNIHRTVKFLGKLDDQRDQQKIKYHLKNYNWMNGTVYIILAIPRILRNSLNESIYLGMPNHDLIIYQEDTSFMDKVMYGTVPNFFILGYYYHLDDHFVNLTLNKNHIAFHNHVVNKEYFNEIKSKLKKLLKKEYSLIFESMNQVELQQLKKYWKQMGYDFQNCNSQSIMNKLGKQLWIIETLKQYLDEENNVKIPPGKFRIEQIMKIIENETGRENGNHRIKKRRIK